VNKTELEDFLVLRDLDEPIPEAAFGAAAEGAMEVLKDLTEEDVGIEWMRSIVRTQKEGKITGTFCHYQAENEAAIYEHADRAGLPVTRIDLYGQTLESEPR
jgi:hypothetical protein